ncbi:hypothetical protein DFH11DRAFT_1690686 [Phellopilus nigrolimitatus]|nr:hypothetical protein DFH11DRAFT_1690686 [Phellopilus nigrolimitatus]
MLRSLAILHVLLFFKLVHAHGDHGHDEAGDANLQYAQRHMATEHHIDSFDPKSFFLIHDLNRDGVLDRDEIEAVYGVHHPYSQKKSKDEQAHQEKADHIVNVVLSVMDKNKDGKVSLEEFLASGLNALPSFEGLGAEGHHYDVESEQFHSTPDTQTDESYNHPEDIEHFAAHEDIERQEVIKEAEFQGISVEEAIAAHDHVEAPSPPADEHHVEEKVATPEISSARPKITRQPSPEKLDPEVRFENAQKDGEEHGEWGVGDKGYKVPKTPGERMRKNVPYKYKFRRNWGDF